MSWKKLGLIFEPKPYAPWMISHAQLPTPVVIGKKIRIYFAPRNAEGKSLITFFEVESDHPDRILYIHPEPVLELGKPGTFDDDGVMPSCLVEDNDKWYFYYSGWNKRVTTPYHNAMGVAVSTDKGITFKRLFEGPILDRTKDEPYIAVTPSVMKDNNDWYMWYSSGTAWIPHVNSYDPVYVIKYACSKNGFDWLRTNQTCLTPHHPGEAFSRPNVIKDNDRYCMWYCSRDSIDFRDGRGSYRIGYAESTDRIHWQRLDPQISLSENGWDSTMQCYPYIALVGEKKYLFYNGNSFGQTGIGYAIWD